MFHHLFGPVPSRRLGRSLGIDLVPAKTCTYNCIFCEVGLTTVLTMERREYVPVQEVLEELGTWSRSKIPADCVTLAGSGEPTLHTRFGEVIDHARSLTGLPVVLLSNGSLFFLPEVRRDAAKANLVKVSLSAWDEPSFSRINAACSTLRLSDVVGGLRDFRREFAGTLWLEVFVMAGINSDLESMGRIAALASEIKPDKVQLNTVDRPPAVDDVYPVSAEQLRELAVLFHPMAEVIGKGRPVQHGPVHANLAGILDMLRRRPCTVDDVVAVYPMEPREVDDLLLRWVAEGRVVEERQGDRRFYRATGV